MTPPTLRHWLGAVALASAAFMLASCDQPQQPRTSRANADRIADSAAPPRDRIGTDIEAKGDVPAAKTPTTLDGAALKVKVKSALLADRGASALDIHVDANAGVVTLSGEVESAETRNRAVEIAEATPGVLQVVDQLIVKAA